MLLAEKKQFHFSKFENLSIKLKVLLRRLEYNDYSIDGKSVVNAGADSKFTATLNDVSGSTGRISIGKAF